MTKDNGNGKGQWKRTMAMEKGKGLSAVFSVALGRTRQGSRKVASGEVGVKAKSVRSARGEPVTLTEE